MAVVQCGHQFTMRLPPVDDVLVEPVGEQLPHGAHVGRLEREVLVGVVAGAAHALDLVHDGGAVLLAPLVAFLDERLAADFQTGDALLGQALVHLGLGGDAGVVGADDPAGLETAHAGAADAGVLDVSFSACPMCSTPVMFGGGMTMV